MVLQAALEAKLTPSLEPIVKRWDFPKCSTTDMSERRLMTDFAPSILLITCGTPPYLPPQSHVFTHILLCTLRSNSSKLPGNPPPLSPSNTINHTAYCLAIFAHAISWPWMTLLYPLPPCTLVIVPRLHSGGSSSKLSLTFSGWVSCPPPWLH